ncbi:hypothetical protein KY331_01485 [Candidatus Woesearchaeota archaeon]|nr:hypothetical protein [Candidatus Woesearchaeota archaeon]
MGKPQIDIEAERREKEGQLEGARASQDGISYYNLCNELGVEPSDGPLYQMGQAESMFQNEEISFETGLEREVTDVPKLWGIRKKDLSLIAKRHLEDVFYGVYNLDIPVEMMDAMNPDEILAKYCAAGEVKRYNGHLSTGLPTDFLELARLLDKRGYRKIGYMVSKCNRRFSTNKGDQEKRLRALDQSVQEAFVKEFFKAYRPSTREEPSNPNAFEDHHDHGKRFYEKVIYNVIKVKWEKTRRD